MSSFSVRPTSYLKGEVSLIGDKSIAHRALIISAISWGKTTIENFPASKDCLLTVSVLKKLGVKIKQGFYKGKSLVITVFGKGLWGLKEPKGALFVGDSGTTLRLILGILAGQNFKVRLVSGKSLSLRPMLRVAQPLRMMGAKIKSKISLTEEYPPITIRGGKLKPITYNMAIASAQVKSAILLAGLYTRGITRVIESIKTRDHTERLLKLFSAEIKVKKNKIVINGNKELVSPQRIYIPGDLSSASFFIVLANLLSNSQILMRNVSLNPSRSGIIRVLKRMGADIRRQGARGKGQGGEPMGNIVASSSSLKGVMVKEEEIPSLIDELPILMVAACFARGETIFKGVAELRVKESDRINSMSENLIKMGAKIKILKSTDSEDISIEGVNALYGARVRSFGDHRTAMSMVVAGLRAKGKTIIDDISCVNKSFPGFLQILKTLMN